MTRYFAKPADLEVHVTEEIGVSDWLTVAQERIDLFSQATEDRQWIHTDVERAKRESPYRDTIAHGFLTLSLLPPLFASAIEIGGTRLSVNYGFNRLRFTRAVLRGERIRARFTLRNYDHIESGAQLTWDTVVESQNQEKPALVMEWLMRRYV